MDGLSSPQASLNSWRNPRTILVLLGLVLLATVIVFAIIQDRFTNRPEWQVSITGQGKVAYQPDTANIILGVQIDKAAEASSALKQLDEKMAKIHEAVIATGISEADVITQNYSLFPQYDYLENSQVTSGYNANQTLLIKVRNLQEQKNKVSQVVAAATAAGANQIQSISFDYSDLNNLKQEARLKAIADAKSKADSLASAAGVKLGKTVGWWENVIYSPDMAGYYYDGKGGGGPNIPVGSQELILEVSVNYEVK